MCSMLQLGFRIYSMILELYRLQVKRDGFRHGAGAGVGVGSMNVEESW